MKHLILLAGLALVLLSAYDNCGGSGGSVTSPSNYGTEIGNPAIGGGVIPLKAVYSTEVVDAACVTLVRCNPALTLDVCDSGLLAAPNVVRALGILSGAYASLADAQTAELQGTLTVNLGALAQCLSDLSALACADPSVTAAYVSADASPFADSEQLFLNRPGSCSNLYN